ncbi:MAG: DegT/DnrJ/EryC1/StrS family aminotransferase [Deferribacteres bacterium]|nr:DegT/DnrJ/EryC1/StrS family aminotransferase [Deferribacteres bacterium]
MISLPRPYLGKKEEKYVLDCVRNNDISQGKYVRRLEEAFSQFIGVKYGSAVNNGTSALHIALTALGVGKGDEVILPSQTFISTASTVVYCGAKPVFVDCTADEWCMDPELVGRAVTRRTRAVIPVHLYGNPCNMKEIRKIARRHHIRIIEDSAQAHGSLYMGRKCGSFSDISCFSFYCNKLMTTGEGGICLTKSKALKERIDLLRAQGKDKIGTINRKRNYPKIQFYHRLLGFNYRLSNINAALGLAQFEKLDSVIARKIRIAEEYMRLFKKHGLEKELVWQKEQDGGRSVYWLFGVLVRDGDIQDRLTKYLNKNRIETRSFYYPLHKHPFFPSGIVTRKDRENGKSVTEELNERGIVLPNDISMTKRDIQKVVMTIKEFFSHV